jgi:hypothetical protein
MTDRRRRCPDYIQQPTLQRQGYRCLYCGVPFGSVLRRGARSIITSVVWDHRVPYAYLGRNPVGNWRAACATCNSIKSDLIFINLVAIRRHIRQKWIEKNIHLIWTPDVSCEEDPQAWATEFARYLTESGQKSGLGPQYVARKEGARIVLDPEEESA